MKQRRSFSLTEAIKTLVIFLLIVMMLATNNPTLKSAISNFTGKFKKNSGKGEKVNG